MLCSSEKDIKLPEILYCMNGHDGEQIPAMKQRVVLFLSMIHHTALQELCYGLDGLRFERGKGRLRDLWIDFLHCLDGGSHHDNENDI